ncbi:competence type IV pilus assembly protein ComGB [Vagococcus vulneris]|uniref:competence type IV pilus assembly protein ComGB n=1 Tax=Vagococcus vulneris TaxID=1977869 RepID=UPI0023E8EADE|nr:competence type IV pilus assembly protein ComGB [Vagococcus vulneris]
MICFLSELLLSGFTLEKSLVFIETIQPKRKKELISVRRQLGHGYPLSVCLKRIGFQNRETAQLQFAEIHGEFPQTLERIATYLKDVQQQKDKMKKTLTYPLLLVTFLIGMMLGLRWFILPQLSSLYAGKQSTNIGLMFIEYLPYIMGGCAILGLLSIGVIRYYVKHTDPIRSTNLFCRLPIIGLYLKEYHTSLFATEWGQLLLMGMEFREIVVIMEGTGYTPLMQAMSVQIKHRLEQGYSIRRAMRDWQFLTPELSLIIQHGEMKGQLGQELVIYGQAAWYQYIQRIERSMVWFQPISFLLIALLIVSVYAGLLLPIYQGMEGLTG